MVMESLIGATIRFVGVTGLTRTGTVIGEKDGMLQVAWLRFDDLADRASQPGNRRRLTEMEEKTIDPHTAWTPGPGHPGLYPGTRIEIVASNKPDCRN